MINIYNTQIAYKLKSDSELKRKRLLFKIISKGWLVKLLKFKLQIALFIHFPIKWIVKPTIFKNFCGGENINEAKNIVKQLSESNISSILDYSAESSDNITDIENVVNEINKTIEFASSNKNVPFVVFKPSALIKSSVLEKKSKNQSLTQSENKEFENFISRIDSLCANTKKNNLKILIDAEYYQTQDIVDNIVLSMMEKYNKQSAVVYNTLQMYRKDRLQYLKNIHKKALENGFILGIKFVRGAYLEEEQLLAKQNNYPNPIHETKENTDNDFNNAIEYTVNNINTIETFCGTHNEESCLKFVEFIKNNNLQNNDSRLWLSQLYGMSDNISYNFANEGYNVVKYIPYGEIKKVMPYLIRRADENKAIAGQTNREVNYINTELKRRKNEN